MFFLTACNQTDASVENPEPQLNQMQAIAELAVLDSYYHNVAKYSEEEAERFLWWTKDKEFWIEYSGVVTVGIDISQVDMEIDGSKITILLPNAEVQNVSVDSSKLGKDSFIVAKNSAKITAEDETFAFGEAQKQLETNASNDIALLMEAQDRAKSLLENYIKNLGKATETEYVIKWEHIADSE